MESEPRTATNGAGLETMGRSARIVLAATIIGLALAFFSIWSYHYRSAEAWLTGRLVGLFADTYTVGDRYHVVGAGDQGVYFRITTECTTSVLLLPVALFGAWAVLQKRLRPFMVLAGIAVAWTVLVTLNSLRLSIIGLSFHAWGWNSFWITHDLVGTLLSAASLGLALLLQFRVTGMRSPATHRNFDLASR